MFNKYIYGKLLILISVYLRPTEKNHTTAIWQFTSPSGPVKINGELTCLIALKLKPAAKAAGYSVYVKQLAYTNTTLKRSTRLLQTEIYNFQQRFDLHLY